MIFAPRTLYPGGRVKSLPSQMSACGTCDHTERKAQRISKKLTILGERYAKRSLNSSSFPIYNSRKWGEVQLDAAQSSTVHFTTTFCEDFNFVSAHENASRPRDTRHLPDLLGRRGTRQSSSDRAMLLHRNC